MRLFAPLAELRIFLRSQQSSKARGASNEPPGGPDYPALKAEHQAWN
jgi:hypothetical protein